MKRQRQNEIQKVFEQHDVDQSGQLSISELEDALNDLGQSVNSTQLEQVLRNVDANGNSLVSLVEFEKIFDESQLLNVFDEIDVDQSGYITVSELELAFGKLGIWIPTTQLQRLLQKVDDNNDGKVSYSEFQSFFCTVPMANLRSIAERWMSSQCVDVGSDLVPPLPTTTSAANQIPLWQFVLAGGMGGTMSRTLTAPLEFVKLQAQTTTNSYRGMMQEFQSCLRQNGIRGLYAGNGVNCLRIFPNAGIGCLAYGQILKCLPSSSDNNNSSDFFWRLLAGSAAGSLATMITYPLDTIRARLTVQDVANHNSYKGIIDAFHRIWAEEGIRHGFYKGIQPTLFAVAPFVAIQQATYDGLKNELLQNYQYKPSVPLFMTCGAMAGMAAQSVVYPLDLLRRRIQVTSAKGVFVDTYLWLAAQKVLRKHGPKGLFQGIFPTLIKVMPAVALSVTVRDAVLGRLG